MRENNDVVFLQKWNGDWERTIVAVLVFKWTLALRVNPRITGGCVSGGQISSKTFSICTIQATIDISRKRSIVWAKDIQKKRSLILRFPTAKLDKRHVRWKILWHTSRKTVEITRRGRKDSEFCAPAWWPMACNNCVNFCHSLIRDLCLLRHVEIERGFELSHYAKNWCLLIALFDETKTYHFNFQCYCLII